MFASIAWLFGCKQYKEKLWSIVNTYSYILLYAITTFPVSFFSLYFPVHSTGICFSISVSIYLFLSLSLSPHLSISSTQRKSFWNCITEEKLYIERSKRHLPYMGFVHTISSNNVYQQTPLLCKTIQ